MKYNWIVGKVYKDRGGRSYTFLRSSGGLAYFDRDDGNGHVLREVSRSLSGFVNRRNSPWDVIYEKTDQELADEIRRLWLQYVPIWHKLKERGYTLEGEGTSHGEVKYRVYKEVKQKVEL